MFFSEIIVFLYSKFYSIFKKFCFHEIKKKKNEKLKLLESLITKLKQTKFSHGCNSSRSLLLSWYLICFKCTQALLERHSSQFELWDWIKYDFFHSFISILIKHTYHNKILWYNQILRIGSISTLTWINL